jgi:hypothetical protein
MLKKRNHGYTMKIILWIAFSINFSIYVISLYSGSLLPIAASIVFTILILHVHKRLQMYYSVSNFFGNTCDDQLTFYQFTKKILGETDEYDGRSKCKGSINRRSA